MGREFIEIRNPHGLLKMGPQELQRLKPDSARPQMIRTVQITIELIRLNGEKLIDGVQVEVIFKDGSGETANYLGTVVGFERKNRRVNLAIVSFTIQE